VLSLAAEGREIGSRKGCSIIHALLSWAFDQTGPDHQRTHYATVKCGSVVQSDLEPCAESCSQGQRNWSREGSFHRPCQEGGCPYSSEHLTIGCHRRPPQVVLLFLVLSQYTYHVVCLLSCNCVLWLDAELAQKWTVFAFPSDKFSQMSLPWKT